MKISTHAGRRLSRAVAVLLLAAGLSVPAAVAAGKQAPDAFQRAVARHEALAGPDAFERAVARHQAPAVPDAFERYAASHPYGLGLTAETAATGEAKNEVPFVASANARPRPIVAHTSTGSDWGNAAIGALGALGIALALTGIAMYARAARKHHSSPAL